jgi:hypothetical protein
MMLPRYIGLFLIPIFLITSARAQNDSLAIKMEVLKKKMPLKLYFHNDEPDPKSLEVSTKANYIEIARNYEKLKPVYLREASNGLSGQEYEAAIKATEDFFANYLSHGIKELEAFTQNLKFLLENGYSVDLKIKGYASPLAKSDYNLNLTKRRISSLKNYLTSYQSGIIADYIAGKANNGAKLTFTDAPFGSEKAASNVSADYYDQQKSVYSKAAAMERKIEIIEFTIAAPAQRESPQAISITEVKVDNQFHDFGTIKYGDVVEHTFKIKNTGNYDLIIYKASASCGCTVPHYTEQPIKPGEEAEVRVVFDTKGKFGKQSTSVVLVTNTKTERLHLNLSANVELKK